MPASDAPASKKRKGVEDTDAPASKKQKAAPSSNTPASNKRKCALDKTSAFKKRRGGPDNSPASARPNKRPKSDRQAKQRDARTISTQITSKAYKNGELDVEKFVKAREYEIRALEQGMTKSKHALSERAFQQVPKELRRRTASHNVKRVPKRLRVRARREMIEDNTPTVTSKTRKPSGRMRLRIETAKKLRALGAKRAQRARAAQADITAPANGCPPDQKQNEAAKDKTSARKVKVKTPMPPPAPPPIAQRKFKKRQVDKMWLPTHVYHAKRAHMTTPKEPLWKFMIPLTPTSKGYRTTHRATAASGAVAWDMSYMTTFELTGRQKSLVSMLTALGAGPGVRQSSTAQRRKAWLLGNRVWEGVAFAREPPQNVIAPIAVIWSGIGTELWEQAETGKLSRSVFVRLHPSASSQIWEELTRLAKVAKPAVTIKDIRYEVGSIEIVGPGATEALLGVLRPSAETEEDKLSGKTGVGELWRSLAGLSNTSMLPSNVVLGFELEDPRLYHPPQPILVPDSAEQQHKVLETCATWPIEASRQCAALFDSKARVEAVSTLPTQSSISRRKGKATPGQYPEPLPTDPRIPALLYSSQTSLHHGKWTLLLPWQYVHSFWQSIVYYPLSTGGQPRFGGLQELRQLLYEVGEPWFPGDHPGTKAGQEWEAVERSKRETMWKRKPRRKRINWDTIKLGPGRKGEVGIGWACDWTRLIQPDAPAQETEDAAKPDPKPTSPPAPTFHQISPTQAHTQLQSNLQTLPPSITHAHTLCTVKLTLIMRGVPQPCARIYQLPTTDTALRKTWLTRLRSFRQQSDKEKTLDKLAKPAPPSRRPDPPPPPLPEHVKQQQRLARALLQPPPEHTKHPECPEEKDLIGFVTAGNYNLGIGQGTAVGCILWNKVLQRIIDDKKDRSCSGNERFMCVVRNAGSAVGRLARWEIASL